VTDADQPLPDRVWRVGYHADPRGFVAFDRTLYSHRFDDKHERFRSLYCARDPRTALREVLADLRRNTAAVARFVAAHGPEAADELPNEPVSAAWRHKHVLTSAVIQADGALLDLRDPARLNELERVHATLLADHGLAHLDLHEITTRRRDVTRAIAAVAYDDGIAVVRFPSSRDGQDCYALFEHRAALVADAATVPLTDPAPQALLDVASEWALTLEPAVPTATN
jgi:hypothetical protein